MTQPSEYAEEPVHEELTLSAAVPHLVVALVPPSSDEVRGAHAIRGEAPTGELRGAHVMKGDPLLSIENRALHAVKVDQEATPEPRTVTLATAPVAGGDPDPAVAADVHLRHDTVVPAVLLKAGSTTRQDAHATARRRWRLIPVAGAASALVLGLGGGGAFAYLRGGVSGSGTGGTTTGKPVTLGVVAAAGTAQLLPGRTGAASFTLDNSNAFGAAFDQVAPGATVVSDNTGLCASSYISIAQTLPYTFSPAVTVSPGGTSGNQSVPNIVKLAPNAPSACQGVTFTVTLTLSGQSS